AGSGRYKPPAQPGSGSRMAGPRPEARGMAAGGSAQVPVAFEDVAVYFSPAEWAELATWQRELYRDVMKENYDLVASLGHPGVKPEIIGQMERGEEPWVGDPWSWKGGSTAQNPCSADGEMKADDEEGTRTLDLPKTSPGQAGADLPQHSREKQRCKSWSKSQKQQSNVMQEELPPLPR
ncbi:zinc finger protein 620, partial [Chelydra serpentina]